MTDVSNKATVLTVDLNDPKQVEDAFDILLAIKTGKTPEEALRAARAFDPAKPYDTDVTQEMLREFAEGLGLEHPTSKRYAGILYRAIKNKVCPAGKPIRQQLYLGDFAGIPKKEALLLPYVGKMTVQLWQAFMVHHGMTMGKLDDKDWVPPCARG